MKAASGARSSVAFDWAMGSLSALLMAGIIQDGWAHNHGKVDESFLTPWHAILYSTMALNGLVLLCVGLLNLRRGYSFRDAIPFGYWLSAVGVIVFLAGGVLDLAWHDVFGVEADLNALVSPTHLMLAMGAALVFSGPIRSVAHQYGTSAGGWAKVGPAVLAVTAMMTLLGFFTQYVQPAGDDSIASVMAKSDEAAVVEGLYVMKADGTSQTRLLPSNDLDFFGPAASPDGRPLAFRVARAGADASDIWVAGANGTGAHRITNTGRHDTQPAWSRDGKWIAFVSSPAGTSGDFRLAIIHPDGSGMRTVHAGVTTLNGPSWSPDGRRIAVGSRSGTTDEIEVFSVADGTATWLGATGGGSWPAWSPDGKSIAFARTDQATGTNSIASTDPSGSTSSVLEDAGSYPSWSPDGKRLAFVKSEHGVDQVCVSTSARGAAVDVSRLSGIDASRPAWTSRGEIVFVASGRSPADRSDYSLALSLAGALVQSVVIAGGALLLVRRWRVPLGALTVVLTLFTLAMATQNDDYFAVPAAFVAGVLADAGLAWWKDRGRTGWPFYALGFGMPALLFALYIAMLVYQRGLGWPPNMVAGAPVISGLAGLLVAFAFDPPLRSPEQS